MKKLQSTLPNMILSLGIITIVSALILAWVYTITEEPIAKVAEEKQIEAIKSVLPSFTNNPLSDVAQVTPAGETKSLDVFPAYDGDTFVGAAVSSYSMEGFAGEINVIFGFDANGTVTGYSVIQQAETPGLGTKMEEWFRSDIADRSVIGLTLTQGNRLTVKKDGGTVDGITAATISSRAFLGSLNRAFEAYSTYKAEHLND